MESPTRYGGDRNDTVSLGTLSRHAGLAEPDEHPVPGFSRNNGDGEQVATAGFVPPVDIFEDEHKLVLKLEIPGVRQEDLDVRMENNTLSIKGERNFQSEGKEENFHRVERRYGSFYRAFTVPTTIEPESIKADYDAGVLRLELQKRPESKPKQIKVNVTSSRQIAQTA